MLDCQRSPQTRPFPPLVHSAFGSSLFVLIPGTSRVLPGFGECLVSKGNWHLTCNFMVSLHLPLMSGSQLGPGCGGETHLRPVLLFSAGTTSPANPVSKTGTWSCRRLTGFLVVTIRTSTPTTDKSETSKTSNSKKVLFWLTLATIIKNQLLLKHPILWCTSRFNTGLTGFLPPGQINK